jgi:hypothetical protein
MKYRANLNQMLKSPLREIRTTGSVRVLPFTVSLYPCFVKGSST